MAVNNLGTIHSSVVNRWFEELCRIKHESLGGITMPGGLRLSHGKLLNKGGVYAFWWTGRSAILKSKKRNRFLELKGPGGEPVSLKIDDAWLGIDTNLPIPLYVGKNAANISKRIGQHLRLKERRVISTGGSARKKKAPTTTCQLRAGFDHFFPSEEDTRPLMLDNVGLSYVILDGNNNAANRFYLEDLAIGLMRPPFNVDVER
jgi:hypothetical protein